MNAEKLSEAERQKRIHEENPDIKEAHERYYPQFLHHENYPDGYVNYLINRKSRKELGWVEIDFTTWKEGHCCLIDSDGNMMTVDEAISNLESRMASSYIEWRINRLEWRLKSIRSEKERRSASCE